MSLEPEEEEFIDWLDTIADYRIKWSDVEAKVKEIEDIPQEDDLENHDPAISITLTGVTVSVGEDGEFLYPIRDIRQGVIDKPKD